MGEEGLFDKRGFPIFAEYLTYTSEVALKFIKDELVVTPEKPIPFYMERFIHCFLNQLDLVHFRQIDDGSLLLCVLDLSVIRYQ